MQTTDAIRHDPYSPQTAVFQTPHREPRPMLRDYPLLPIADARSEPGPLRQVAAGWVVAIVFGLAALAVSVL
jgi:hypothetical protein